VRIEDVWEQFFRTRDPALREKLILHYAPLVRQVAARLGIGIPGVIDREDLIGYGMVGLIQAVDRYDPTRRVKFETFARQRVRGAIVDALRQLDIHPRGAARRLRELEEVHETLYQRLGRHPTDAEVAKALGLSVEAYREALLHDSAQVLSLETPLRRRAAAGAPDDSLTVADRLAGVAEGTDPAEYVEEQEAVRVVAEAIRTLPERDRLVLALYFKEELTFAEIGAVLGISPTRAIQLYTRAIMRLRAAAGAGFTTPVGGS
jgi:RNA polymerase sigma factor for flagellar operon FliA